MDLTRSARMQPRVEEWPLRSRPHQRSPEGPVIMREAASSVFTYVVRQGGVVGDVDSTDGRRTYRRPAQIHDFTSELA